MKRIIKIFWVLLIVPAMNLMAQPVGGNKTIEITSQFKPAFIPPQKPGMNPSAYTGTPAKLPVKYSLPVEQLQFRFTPTALKPLAFTDTTRPAQDKGYVKAGFGNFSSPYVKAILRYGNGTTSSGQLEGNFTSAKGKLPFQQFTRYGISTHNDLMAGPNHALQVRGGFNGHQTYRYGYTPVPSQVNKDSLKLSYSDINAGATLANIEGGDFGLQYKATVDVNIFNDGNKGSETALTYDLPLSKSINDKLHILVGLSGLVSRFKQPDTVFNNNLTLVRAGAQYFINEKTNLTAALVPSWNNGTFALLPDVQLETFIPNKNLVLQAGIKGNYIRQTFRTLASLNPWIQQPTELIHAKNTEIFVALKGKINEAFAFRVKGSYQRRNNAALMVNDGKDGKTFNLIFDEAMNILGASAELTWQKNERFIWTNQLTLQAFSGQKTAAKAFGMLPFEWQSNFTMKVIDKLTATADVYAFLPTWHLTRDAKVRQGNSAFDLNLGAAFDILPKMQLWLQFHNVFNNTYQRWNQYQVLGFQAQGGVIVRF